MKNWNLGTSSALFDSGIIEGKLNECSEAGFKYVEAGLKNPGTETQKYVESLAEELKGTSIKVWSIHLPFGRDLDISDLDEEKRGKVLEELLRIIDMAAPLKPSVAVIHGSSEPIVPELREDRILTSIKSLKTLLEKCSEYGISLAIECLPRTCIGNCSDEIVRIVKEVPGLKVCFDTNHLTIEDPMEFVKRTGKYIVSTHVSDYDMVDERHWLPGKGCNDWQSLLESLESAGYDGPVMFEVVNRPGTEWISLEMLAQNWHSLVESFNKE